jgi:hypothetical protein
LVFTFVEGPTELPGRTRKLSAWARAGAAPSRLAVAIQVLAAMVVKETPACCIEGIAVVSTV